MKLCFTPWKEENIYIFLNWEVLIGIPHLCSCSHIFWIIQRRNKCLTTCHPRRSYDTLVMGLLKEFSSLQVSLSVCQQLNIHHPSYWIPFALNVIYYKKESALLCCYIKPHRCCFMKIWITCVGGQPKWGILHHDFPFKSCISFRGKRNSNAP